LLPKSHQTGDELFFDYGVKDEDINWANADASKIAIKLQDGTLAHNNLMHTESGHLLCHWFVLFNTLVADLGPSSTSNE